MGKLAGSFGKAAVFLILTGAEVLFEAPVFAGFFAGAVFFVAVCGTFLVLVSFFLVGIITTSD
jgi:hypothetical protein